MAHFQYAFKDFVPSLFQSLSTALITLFFSSVNLGHPHVGSPQSRLFLGQSASHRDQPGHSDVAHAFSL